jgi:hypothetical protein
MKKKTYLLFALLLFINHLSAEKYTLSNKYMTRVISTDSYLHTVRVENKKLGTQMNFETPNEFLFRLSDGTSLEGTDRILTSKDFTVEGVRKFKLEGKEAGTGLEVYLRNVYEGLELTVRYEMPKDKPYMRKYIQVGSRKVVTLERIDVENLTHPDFYQPYTCNAITAQAPGNWKPNLGQPIFTKTKGLYFGVEFPASFNTVDSETMNLGYFWGREVAARMTYNTYKSVVGVSEDTNDYTFAFQRYIDDIRIHPVRLQVQYNSWFDYTSGVNQDNFSKSVKKVHQELVTERGVKPLKAYVIDDGWQDNSAKNVSKKDGVWDINSKFSVDFAKEHELVKSCGSTLGIWLSPASILGSTPQVKPLRAAGLEAFDIAMSLAGPRYMNKLEKRVTDFSAQGVTYFKYDGIFGHLNTRHFELHGRGTPRMNQLSLDGLLPHDKRLNDTKYDELKIYYLVAATERLMEMLKAQNEVNPDVFTCISNAAYLSPWWLSYADVVWMINAGDAAGGSNRNEELVYRDGIYHNIFVKENTQFPINSLFNHEPKKTKTGESKEVFEDYLFMNLSRGTCFVELYLKTFNLSESDWDVLAHGLKWVDEIFPMFKSPRMVGGDPKKSVYGYTGWIPGQGYLSLHNPLDTPQTFQMVLDKKIGLSMKDKNLELSSPLGKRHTKNLQSTWSYGESFEVTLQPKEIRVLTFGKK